MKLRFINILPLLLSLLACSSCIYDNFGECPGDGLVADEQYINLDIHVNVNDGAVPYSRSEDKDYGDFEGLELAADNYEKVHTLRVVIVSGNGLIEHNRMVTVKDNYNIDVIHSGNLVGGDLRFKVKAGDTKRIYLFANESAVNINKTPKPEDPDAAVEGEDYKFDFATELEVGKKFPTETISNLLIKRKTDKAFIDNDNGEEKNYVPMSESFEVVVPGFQEIPDQNSETNNGTIEKFITKTLFITRSLIKFSFTVKLRDTGITKTQLALRGVKISNLANEGYYLPNSTAYSPILDVQSTLVGREITNFNVPYNYENSGADDVSDCIFSFNEDLPISSNQEESGSIMTYLPESKTTADKPYMVTLLFTDGKTHYESRPLAIKYIPRNTHVKVNMVLTTSQLETTVAIVPYTSVVLDPLFGFEAINPGQKPEGEEENQPES